jgi:hypothetical protein
VDGGDTTEELDLDDIYPSAFSPPEVLSYSSLVNIIVQPLDLGRHFRKTFLQQHVKSSIHIWVRPCSYTTVAANPSVCGYI